MRFRRKREVIDPEAPKVSSVHVPAPVAATRDVPGRYNVWLWNDSKTEYRVVAVRAESGPKAREIAEQQEAEYREATGCEQYWVTQVDYP